MDEACKTLQLHDMDRDPSFCRCNVLAICHRCTASAGISIPPRTDTVLNYCSQIGNGWHRLQAKHGRDVVKNVTSRLGYYLATAHFFF